jgi:hypothetical protein
VLLANQANRQHGPGLNQGISWLAARPGPRRFRDETGPLTGASLAAACGG